MLKARYFNEFRHSHRELFNALTINLNYIKLEKNINELNLCYLGIHHIFIKFRPCL